MTDTLSLIQFESSTACNGRCTMCPRHDMTRRGGMMSETLFRKILADGMAMGVQHYIPFLNGEPLLDPRFFDWMDIMRDLGLTTTIFTNVSWLDRRAADRLAAYPNITSVVLSFHGGTKEAYERVMGLNYDDSKAKAEYFISIAPYQVQAYMTVFEDNAGTVQDFRNTWGERAFVGAYFNWAGARPSVMTQAQLHPPKPCARVLSQMTILWDGRVNLCCMDYDGAVILGDANTEPLSAIWERNVWMREQHKALNFDMPLCRDCNMNRWGV